MMQQKIEDVLSKHSDELLDIYFSMDSEIQTMSKLQEIQLMDHAAKGISQSENVTEYVSVEEDEKKKIWMEFLSDNMAREF